MQQMMHTIMQELLLASIIRRLSDHSAFDNGMDVGDRQTGMSISETEDLLRFLHSNVFTEWFEEG